MTDLRLALVQADLRWEDPAANLAHLDALLEGLRPVDVIVLPEMFSTGFSMRARELAEPWSHAAPAQAWLQALASRTGALVVGSLIVREGELHYNRLIAQFPSGERLHYDKRHLFALAGEHRAYSDGKTNLTLAWQGWHIRPFVCYDLRFPVWMRNRLINPTADARDDRPGQQTEAYDLALVVANWPEARSHHWRRLAAARAIENQCYLAAVNRVGTDGQGLHYRGDTALYDYHGEALGQLVTSEGVLVQTLRGADLIAYRQKYPFYTDADAFRLL